MENDNMIRMMRNTLIYYCKNREHGPDCILYDDQTGDCQVNLIQSDAEKIREAYEKVFGSMSVPEEEYSADRYQQEAARTIRKDMHGHQLLDHALYGLGAEVGELQGLYQKTFQGHALNLEHVKRELGDICWFICEYCTICGIKFSDVLKLNIEKLRERYPDGFDEEKSIHRKEGDV